MGRRAHLDAGKFTEFLASVPENLTNGGYWRLKREYLNPSGGGILQNYVGYLGFENGEVYDQLRERVRQIAEKYGPGVYYSIPCDERKKELPALGMVKFEYKEEEVPVPMTNNAAGGGPDSIGNPIRETINNVKRVQKDMADMQALEMQQKMMEKLFGKPKEDDDVKDKESGQTNSMQDLMMYRMLFNNEDGKKSASSTPVDPLTQLPVIQQVFDAKLATAMADVKGQLAQMQAQQQAAQQTAQLAAATAAAAQKPDDSKFERMMDKLEAARREDNARFERLLEKLSEKSSSEGKQENSFQTMMAIMMKQSEERDRLRLEEQKRAEDLRREEDKRRDDLARQREQDKKDDERRHNDDLKASETARKEELKAAEASRKEEERRREEDRRDEKRRTEEGAKTERTMLEQRVTEERRRFDEEMKLRREELKNEQERARLSANDQQKYQLQMFELLKSGKDSGLEMTAKIVETMTSAGITSMKTAQEAAETIMDVAKKAGPNKDEGGFMDLLKGMAPLAGALLTPAIAQQQAAAQQQAYAQQAAAQQQAAQQQRARQVQAQRQRQAEAEAYAAQQRAAAQQQTAAQQQAAQAAAQQAAQKQAAAAQQDQTQVDQGTAGPSVDAETQASNMEGMSMIAQYLKAYPILKEALIGNLQDKLGVDTFIPIVEGLNQPALEGLLANLPAPAIMRYVKEACTDEEKKLIDENAEWFRELRKAMIEFLKPDDEEEDLPEEKAVNKEAADGGKK